MIVAVKAVQTEKITPVDSSWINLFEYVKQHPYCVLEIEFKQGRPITALKAMESVKF